jgi:hypothetical protein
MSRIYECLWNQRNRYTGVKDYYNVVAEVCSDYKGVDLIGLFMPQNEPWNWAYFIVVDSAETKQSIFDEINSRYYQKRENISQSFSRYYTSIFNNPKPSGLGRLKFLHIELDVVQGIDPGLKQHHDARCRVFDGQEGVWYQGQYRVWNEPYNWAYFFWYRSWARMRVMSDASWRAVGQPINVPIINVRSYERYDPIE